MPVDSKLFQMLETKNENGLTRSDWSHVIKGTPQVSTLGPYVFNVFQNDLMYLLNSRCDIYNYADDNTVWGECQIAFNKLNINL